MSLRQKKTRREPGSSVLVTGGTGFIGANVVRVLLEQGEKVRCVVRDSSPGICLAGLPVERLRLDLLADQEVLRRTLRNISVIYHLAGSFDPRPEGPAAMRRVHVDATRNLGEAALASGVSRMVVCSSSITLGWGPAHAPGTELTPVADPDACFGVGTSLRAYHDTKLASEELARELTGRGLDTVVVNPDFVVGPWDLKPTSGALILAMAKRWIPLWPRGGKSFVDADDCARAIVAAMARGAPGERYLLANHHRTYEQFMKEVAEVVGCRAPVAPVPDAAQRLLERVGGALQRRLPGRVPGLDPQVLAQMSQVRFRDGARARAELHPTVTPLHTSIERCHRWFRDHDYL